MGINIYPVERKPSPGPLPPQTEIGAIQSGHSLPPAQQQNPRHCKFSPCHTTTLASYSIPHAWGLHLHRICQDNTNCFMRKSSNNWTTQYGPDGLFQLHPQCLLCSAFCQAKIENLHTFVLAGHDFFEPYKHLKQLVCWKDLKGLHILEKICNYLNSDHSLLDGCHDLITMKKASGADLCPQMCLFSQPPYLFFCSEPTFFWSVPSGRNYPKLQTCTWQLLSSKSLPWLIGWVIVHVAP